MQMSNDLSNVIDGRPLWIGNFAGNGADFIIFKQDNLCALVQYDDYHSLKYSKPPYTESLNNISFLIGNYHGLGRTQVLFCDPNSKMWWIGNVDLPNMYWHPLGNNFPMGDFISIWNSKAYWVGDFNGDGKAEVLIYIENYKDNHWWLGQISDYSIEWNNLSCDSLNFFVNSRCFTGMFVNDSTQLLYFSDEDKRWYISYFIDNKIEWIQLENIFDKDFQISFSENFFLTGNFTDLQKAQIYCIDLQNNEEWIGTVDGGKLWWVHIGTFRYGSTSKDKKQWYVGNFDGSCKSQILMVDNKETLQIRFFDRENSKWHDVVWENYNNYPEILYDISIPDNMCKNLYVGNYIAPYNKSNLLSYSESSGNYWIGSLSFENRRNLKGESYFYCSISWNWRMNYYFEKNLLFHKYRENRDILGLPLTDISSLTDFRYGKFWRFENGAIVLKNIDYIIYGEVYRIWKDLMNELGYPASDLRYYERIHYGRGVICQHFCHGDIYKTTEGEFTACHHHNGLSLPLVQYRFTLDSVICHSATPGIGKDEFLVTLISSASPAARNTGEKTITDRHQDRNFSTGAHHTAGKVLFEGSLPDRMTVSYIALEVDDETKASDVCSEFEYKVQEQDADIEYFAGLSKYTDYNKAVGGAVLGTALGIGFGLGAGLILGGILAGMVYLKPDLLALDRIDYNASELRKIMNTEKSTEKVFYENDFEFEGIKVHRYFFWDDSVNTWFESRIYKTEDSEYELKFGHYFG